MNFDPRDHMVVSDDEDDNLKESHTFYVSDTESTDTLLGDGDVWPIEPDDDASVQVTQVEDNSGPIDLTEEDDDVPEIDLTNEDVLEMLTVEEVEHLQAIRDRYPASPRTSPPPRSDTPVRCVEIQAARSTGNIHLEPGMTVEMHPDRDLHQTVYGDFIRIKKIFYNLDDHSITLRGQKFRRTHKLKGMLHTHMTNEVYMVLHESLDIGIQSDLEISLDQVLNVRTLIITNRPFPSLSWRDDIKWTGTGLDEIKWQGPLVCAFDRNPDAVATYRANFRRTRIFCQDATAFITSAAGRLVDVLHISPPCQPWSPAHTIDGKDDAANIASLFTVSELIQKLRPRIVTIEQTAGLLQRHPVFFHTLIRQLTDHGYGISWQIIQCLGYGNPSVRKRLLMIASCPGEPHPPFTKPTHGTSPGVIPFRTIHNAISSVRPGMPNHNPESYIRKNEAPYSAHKPVDQCITTNGGKASVHPSGKRDFTNRELAALQAFNHTHVFVGTRSSVRRQIGNALPPVVSKALYIEIVKCLRETDEREAREDDIVMIE
ncbi:hypothetical protein M8818_003076 [Zalaria obscura]|uniref:Uncharacterized protein n=1 Tax=Zalaria obscura TaxID=2024903 RepID=A0ACC3SHU1_9PEZI